MCLTINHTWVWGNLDHGDPYSFKIVYPTRHWNPPWELIYREAFALGLVPTFHFLVLICNPSWHQDMRDLEPRFFVQDFSPYIGDHRWIVLHRDVLCNQVTLVHRLLWICCYYCSLEESVFKVRGIAAHLSVPVGLLLSSAYTSVPCSWFLCTQYGWRPVGEEWFVNLVGLLLGHQSGHSQVQMSCVNGCFFSRDTSVPMCSWRSTRCTYICWRFLWSSGYHRG